MKDKEPKPPIEDIGNSTPVVIPSEATNGEAVIIIAPEAIDEQEIVDIELLEDIEVPPGPNMETESVDELIQEVENEEVYEESVDTDPDFYIEIKPSEDIIAPEAIDEQEIVDMELWENIEVPPGPDIETEPVDELIEEVENEGFSEESVDTDPDFYIEIKPIEDFD